MAPLDSTRNVFDDAHYASTAYQKLKRSLQLGPKYYLLDIPRYLWHRRFLQLPFWDFGALANPLREFRKQAFCEFPLPASYSESLKLLGQAGVHLTMPRQRLEALLGAWWATREKAGEVIECGSYRGATALLIALLAKLNRRPQMVYMLDTFSGIPDTSRFDVARAAGEFMSPEGQVDVILTQARALGIQDQVEVHRGLFSESFGRLEQRSLKFAFVHIDANIYQGTLEACRFTLPRTVSGGIVVFDDYNGVCDLGARLAIDQYRAGKTLDPKPLAGSSAWLQVP